MKDNWEPAESIHDCFHCAHNEKDNPKCQECSRLEDRKAMVKAWQESWRHEI